MTGALRKVLKQTSETLEGSVRAGTNDERTALLREQVAILEGYLPEQVSGDDLKTVVDRVLAENGFSEKRDMGKAIGLVVAATGGNVDKAEVAQPRGFEARVGAARASEAVPHGRHSAIRHLPRAGDARRLPGDGRPCRRGPRHEGLARRRLPSVRRLRARRGRLRLHLKPARGSSSPGDGRSPTNPSPPPCCNGDRYAGRPVYFSDVIVRAGSDARSFADLRGRSFAYNEPSSHSGYGVVRYELVKMGETHGFFGRTVMSGAHRESIRMVAEGAVDGSAIDSQVLELEMRDHPDLLRQLRVVDTLGPSTIQPVVAAAHVEPVITSGASETRSCGWERTPRRRPFLDRGLVSRFVSVGPESYADVRAMIEAAEAAHFLVLR